MTGFLTFAVYSLRISTDLPVQSDYIPKITAYFVFSIAINLLVMLWYVQRNHFIAKGEMPAWLSAFAVLMKRVFCYCFPPEKKVTPKDGIKEKEKPNDCQIILISEKPQDVPVLPVAVAIETKTEVKQKCNFCNRCETCEADLKKEKDKGKNKKEVESKCDALNWFLLVVVFVTITCVELGIWTSINNNS